MESRVCRFLLYSTITAILFIHCDARKSMGLVKDPTQSRSSVIKHTKELQLMSKLMSLLIEQPTDTSNTQPYGVSSPFSLPPFDSLPPVNSPPLSPTSPIYNFPPVLPGQNPPPGSAGTVPSPPDFSVTPNPPEIVPSPSGPILRPPYHEPSPPAVVLSPPFYVPPPFGFGISPPVFLPPIVYPPPTVPPPPKVAPTTALWCVAKPSVPDPIIQEAMNYVCGSGAYCDSIQPSGSCFRPDTLFAHASYAFNSYWQRTKLTGGKCEFGGTAILVSVDPSYDDCHFEYHY